MKKICQLNDKGQLTLPKAMRDILEIKENDYVDVYFNTTQNQLVIEKNENKNHELFNLINYFIKKHPNLIILIQGKIGCGKNYLAKIILKNYFELLKDLNPDKEIDWFLNQQLYILEDETYDKGLVKELEDKLTIITNHQDIDVQNDDLLKNSQRPILSIYFSSEEKYHTQKVLFYIDGTKKPISLRDSLTKLPSVENE